MTTVINTNPSVFNFDVDGYSDTTKLTQQNFITDKSKFIATMEVTLPMWFRAGDFALEDTIQFDFSKIGGGTFTTDNIQFANLRLSIVDSLPIDAKMQVYFADSTFQVLDSMFTDTQPQIPSAVVDTTTYKIISTSSKTSDAILDNVKIKKIKNTKWALVKASLSTFQYKQNTGLRVKFYNSYKLKYQLSIKAQVKVTDKNF
jgi:hypothetical protein